MKLFINNILIPNTEYTNSATIDVTDNTESAEKTRVVSTEYKLTGMAYEIIRDNLIEVEGGNQLFLPVRIFEDECCDEDILLFEGIVRGDTVDWCYGECSCTVQFVEHTEETQLLDCVKSTLIFDNHNGFQEQQHPRMVYCVELRPSFMQDVILIFGVLFNIVFILLTPVIAIISVLVSVINVIIDVLNTIPGVSINNIDFDGDNNTNTLQEYNNLVGSINELIVGCGRKHPSPLVRDYITNVCDKCGLSFQSSILNDSSSEYYNSVYFFAPVEKGTRDEDVLWIDQNKPILTLEGLLEQLKPVFSADWEIQGTTLVFEREDFFHTGDIFVNYETLLANAQVNEKLCLSWRDEEKPAYARFDYTEDPVDWVGNEAKARYSDIVEWNNPFSEIQKGVSEHRFSFGMPRFRDDGIDRDVLADYDGWLAFGIGQTIIEHERVLIMNNGTCFQPKLLIWDGDTSFGRVVKYNISGYEIPEDENYNFPYTLNEHNVTPVTAYPANQPNMALYGRFHAWKHPKLNHDNGLNFTFSFFYNCTSLQLAVDAQFVQLPMGIGRIEKTSIDLANKTITVQGKV